MRKEEKLISEKMKNIQSSPRDDRTYQFGIAKFTVLVSNNLVDVNWYQSKFQTSPAVNLLLN